MKFHSKFYTFRLNMFYAHICHHQNQPINKRDRNRSRKTIIYIDSFITHVQPLHSVLSHPRIFSVPCSFFPMLLLPTYPTIYICIYYCIDLAYEREHVVSFFLSMISPNIMHSKFIHFPEIFSLHFSLDMSSQVSNIPRHHGKTH